MPSKRPEPSNPDAWTEPFFVSLEASLAKGRTPCKQGALFSMWIPEKENSELNALMAETGYHKVEIILHALRRALPFMSASKRLLRKPIETVVIQCGDPGDRDIFAVLIDIVTKHVRKNRFRHVLHVYGPDRKLLLKGEVIHRQLGGELQVACSYERCCLEHTRRLPRRSRKIFSAARWSRLAADV